MALAHSGYLSWMESLNTRSQSDARSEEQDLGKHDSWQPPRVDAATALDQAATMADRCHKMYLRALRALRDLRRYTPSLVVQNVGQLNLAQAQVNVQGTGAGLNDGQGRSGS
jgi:hypothetical protein